MEDRSEYITTQEVEDGLAMFWQDKPKEIPSVMSGFTPAPDVLIKKYGFVTALVWGRVWRYCQGPDGICRAKLETIAGELKMSVRNVIRDIKELCKDGYLKDTTPNLRNRPHIYADTFKIRIRISVEAAMTQSHSTMTASHPHNDSESLEESIKKQSKKQKIKEGATKPAAPRATDFPSNVLYREVTERYPSKANWHDVLKFMDGVSQRLGRTPTKDDLAPFYSAWCGMGWNTNSINWLEYAVKGVLPGKTQPVKNNGISVAQSWLARKEQEEQNVRA